jgi:hypothetical protein
VKWAGGSRSQTHRLAAMGRFTQDDGYVRGVASSTAPRILLELVQLLATSASPRDKYLIPIPVPVQYRLSRCLE